VISLTIPGVPERHNASPLGHGQSSLRSHDLYESPTWAAASTRSSRWLIVRAVNGAVAKVAKVVQVDRRVGRAAPVVASKVAAVRGVVGKGARVEAKGKDRAARADLVEVRVDREGSEIRV